MPRLLRALAVLSAALVLLVGLPVQGASAVASAPEREFLSAINAERTSRGIAPLVLSPDVSDRASRPWAEHLASTGVLAHSGTGQQILTAVRQVYGRADRAGENVGYAGSVAQLHGALMASPGHRANLLDPRFRYLGLGVARSGSRTWVTQTFFTTTEQVRGEDAPQADGGAASAARPAVTDAQAQAYVRALYLDFLGRPADSGGLSWWSSMLTSGRMSHRDLALTMATSDEWLTVVVTGLYREALGRSPDAQGLSFWRAQLRAGMPVAELAARLWSADERFASAGGDRQRWVTALYQGVLQRQPDAAGREFWAERATSSGRLTVALELYQSPENLARRVGGLYRDLLDRAPDPSGLVTWPDVVRRDGDLSLASALASSPEYRLRAGG